MRICFYYEYKSIVGGLTSLLLTLIKELRKQGADVVLFNYKDGLIAKELEACSIELTIIDIQELDWNEIEKTVRSTDVFVISGFIELFHRFFKINPRIVFYNIDDYLADISKYKFGINPRYLAKKLIGELIQKKSLLLMDDTGIRRAAEKLNFKISKPVFLPVPVAVPAENRYLAQQAAENNIIRLTYIGRSVDWKMYPLKKIFNDAVKAATSIKKRVAFSIVVDSLNDLKRFINIETYHVKNICEIIIYENIRPSEINTFLLEHSDLNFAMGTSALESGKLGIPTILMDFSRKDMPVNYKYVWLYHTTNFGLGRDVEETYTPPAEGLDMATLLANVSHNKKYISEQSVMTYAYVKEHHSVETIVTALLEYADAARFRFRSAQPYILYYNPLHRQVKKLRGAVSKRDK